ERKTAQSRLRMRELDRQLGELGIGEDIHNRAEALQRLRRETAIAVETQRTLESVGEALALALARSGEQARRAETQRQVEDFRKQIDEMQRAIILRNQTTRLVDSIVDGLRDTADDVVKAKLESIHPLLRRVYARVDPHPTFRDPIFHTALSYGRGRLSI